MGNLNIFRDSLQRIDFSEIRDNKTDGKGGFAIKAGLTIINKAIQKSLGNITDQYFFEYSLLSSTINPNTKKLFSFAGVKASTLQFKKNVDLSVNGIINIMYPTDGSQVSREKRIETLSQNWFHNPEMFLYPSINELGPYYIKGEPAINPSPLVGQSEALQLELVDGCQDIYAANMSYERTLDEMLEASKIIADRKKDLPNPTRTQALIEEYHKGASELKYLYDQYLPIAGEQYDYITFPIVSTYNSDITDHYKKYFLDFDKDHVAGIGHFFLYLRNPGPAINEDTLNDLFIRVNQILNHIALNYVYGTGILLAENARKEAIKSAKAAIMSRNLSHNLGSHVMSYLKQSLKSVADMERYGALEEMSPKGEPLPKNPELPYLVGTGRFISYLQERQDYIATVSTDYIPYPSVVNFKDGIYDELNPDYRFLRHKEWAGHKPANILLENIARSEGLSRQPDGRQTGNNIVIKYRKFNGLNKDEDAAKADYESLRKWNFSLPGGVMGRQAVFSIVENVIRNAAKHGQRDAGQDLVVTFDILDPSDDDFKDRIKSFGDGFSERYSSVKTNDYGYAKDINDLYVVTLTTNTKAITDNDKDIVNKIRDAIHESLVDDGGNLKKSNKGIKEMVISAAWLRNLRIEELDEKTRKELAPILRVRSDEDGNLQYVFCIPRVKEVALIVKDNGNDLLQKKNDNAWINNGWYVFTVEEYKSLVSKNFNFIILDKDLLEKKDEVRKCSTNRFFIEAEETGLKEQEMQFSMADCKGLVSKEDFFNKEKELYEQLADEDDDFVIAISDESNKTNVDSDHVTDVQMLVNKENDLSDFRFVYRKHNDTKEEFDKFVDIYRQGADWGDLEFVEGITGGNSTDRLIRHAVLDDVWAYKHLHAMKTNVAIFDERLFANTTGIELSDLQNAQKDWEGILDGQSVGDARTMVKEFDNNHDGLISDDRDLRMLFVEYSKEKILDFVTTYYPDLNEFPISEISSVVCHKKKIDLFTFTKTNNGVIIWGGNFASDGDNGCYGCVEAVGKIVFNKDGKPIVKRYEGFKTMYDYISLHQGLLDKVYEAMPPNMDNENNRLAVTQAIYKIFLNSENNDNDYLQGMVIHSGRSKPNEKDMPQHQPFLQYSAIENALFDCKYSLVEVFDFACFDKTNEN